MKLDKINFNIVNTKNGINYEKITNLSDKFKIIKTNKYYHIIKFSTSKKKFIYTKQFNFLKCMKDEINNNINTAHGCKNPDECYIHKKRKVMFIIEKKFQNSKGSSCEKIQTPDFKIWQYNRLFPSYKIVYIYCLSKWFKINCKAEIEYLKYKNIPYFWGYKKNYKNKIIKFIISY